MKTTDELREGFLSFFEERGHTRFPSWSLIPPADDPSTLFISAGMQPLKPYFSGAKEPPAPRFTTVQKVLRAGGKDTDLDQVGLDGAARVDVRDARQLLVRRLLQGRRDRPRLGVRHRADGARPRAGSGRPCSRATPSSGWGRTTSRSRAGSARACRASGSSRSRAATTSGGRPARPGPCGPCSELHLDRGEEHGCGLETCGPNCDECDRFIEFWNLVFMEFDLHADGTLTPLPKQNIDTGMGLERGAMLLQGADSIFDTDGFRLIMDWIERESGVGYHDSPAATKAHRVISDHGRGTTFLVAEGVTPSNEGRGYVLRRLIRRAVVQARRIGLEDVYRVTGDRGRPGRGVVPGARRASRRPSSASSAAEEERFRETLERGLKVFEELAGQRGDHGRGGVHARRHARVPDRAHGRARRGARPARSTSTATARRWRGTARSRARAATRASRRPASSTARPTSGPSSSATRRRDVRTQIGALAPAGEGRFLAKLRESPFYAAGGGQVTDAGWIEDEDGAAAELVEAFRLGDDQVLAVRRRRLRGGRARARDRPVARALPDDGEPHGHAPAAPRAPRRARRPRASRRAPRSGPDKLRFDFTHDRAR